MSKYSKLISEVALDFSSNFAALASPTLSKQETVTGLSSLILKNKKGEEELKKRIFKALLKFFPRLIFFFYRLSYSSFFFKSKIPKNSIIFRTWLVPRSFKNGELVDDYFRELINQIEGKYKILVSFTSLDVKILRKFKKLNKKSNFINSYSLLSFFDIIKLLSNFLFKGLVKPKKKYFLDGYDVTNFIKYSLLLDYLEFRSFEAFAENYKTNILIKSNPKAYVYIYENQSWEKVVNSILKENNVLSIGYQSSGFSPVFLNFFPNKIDASRMLMPNVLLTVGNNYTKYLKENGCYNILVQTFAALRFSYPHISGKYIVEKPVSKRHSRILYAFPVQIDQYESLIKDLIELFINTEIQVDLKIHPLYQTHEIDKKITLPINFKIISNVDINNLKHNYDFVLFNDNSFGIEALLKGVKSYQYDPKGLFLDDRYMYFDLWKVNYKFKDIAKLRDLLIENKYEKEFSKDLVSLYINQMYKPFTLDSLDSFELLLKTKL